MCLFATVIGCRESKDRIEFAQYLKDFVKNKRLEKEGKPVDEEFERKEKEKPYVCSLSDGLMDFIERVGIDRLAMLMPKYDLITPSLACILMKEVRQMLGHKEILEILQEK